MRIPRAPGPVAGTAAPGALGLAAILLASLLLPAEQAGAQERSLSIREFRSTVRVYRTARLEVTEEIAFRFDGAWNGVYRDILTGGRRPDGSDWRIHVDVESVTDVDGGELRYETSREDAHRRVKVWVPDARDTTRTVVIRYRVEGALLFHSADEDFEGGDFVELNWNVTGHGWRMPIRDVSATVHLPTGVTGVRARAWAGPYGARAENVDLRVRGPVVEADTREPLDRREGLTVDVAWDAGVVERPGLLARATSWTKRNWLLLIPILALAGMLRVWWVRGRDPRRRSIAARYEPPEGLRPGEVGVLVDHRPDMRDVTATIVDLAVRGHMVVEEREEAKLLGLSSEKAYAFERRTEPSDWKELHDHEQRLLEALFDGGSRRTVEMSELEDEFYEDLPDIENGLFARLLELGYYERRPDRVRSAYLGGAVVVVVLIFTFGVMLAERFGLNPGSAIFSALGTGLVTAGIGWFMPARTKSGVRAWEAALGFEEFLERVEEDRFRRMIQGPEDFEKYLPYAMALQVEKKWAAAFEDIYTEPPDWYRGTHPGGFHTIYFASAMSDFSTRAGAAMTSSPRGAGSSGFSGGGGGFSGGGVGGGGGGGF